MGGQPIQRCAAVVLYPNWHESDKICVLLFFFFFGGMESFVERNASPISAKDLG